MNEKKKRRLQGIITSNAMDQTVVVEVVRVKKHIKYHKRYSVSKKYKADDPKNVGKVGDKVIIEECRPLSKDKKWRIVNSSKIKDKK